MPASRATWNDGGPTAGYATAKEQPARGHPSPKRTRRRARGPSAPESDTGNRAPTSDALDGGHGRPGMAEPAGLRWEAGGRQRQRPPTPPRQAGLDLVHGNRDWGLRRRGPRSWARVPAPATPRAAGSQTARTGRAGLGAAVSRTLPPEVRASVVRWRRTGRAERLVHCGSSSTRSTYISTRPTGRRSTPGRTVSRCCFGGRRFR